MSFRLGGSEAVAAAVGGLKKTHHFLAILNKTQNITFQITTVPREKTFLAWDFLSSTRNNSVLVGYINDSLLFIEQKEKKAATSVRIQILEFT